MNEFFANPGAILSFSVPFGTWFGARVRLHFWLLVSLLFLYIDGFRTNSLFFTTAVAALTIMALILHEFGHRIAAQAVGGFHDEFVLWPPGGVIPAHAPSRPLPTFIAHGGGVAMSLFLAIASGLALYTLHRLPPLTALSTYLGFPGVLVAPAHQVVPFLTDCLAAFFSINLGLVSINLVLLFYWFDGGYLLQAILWPWIGLYQAINVTCIVGMVEAALLFAMALMFLGGANLFFGLAFAALLFSSAFTRRRMLQAAGPEDLQNTVSDSAGYEGRPPRKKLRKSWFKRARRKATQEQAEQAKIDAILAKVHDHGLHSLTWWEKRTLKKATERQRQRDLAERL